ncbi:MAG TPA: fluoride efflux transporter CrcB [Flavobacteriaceae bacterium]|nr:fluoride efflux transporter CrcB [Flavobacteriaceae bacterium]
MKLLLVFLGGGLGSTLRYLASVYLMNPNQVFPKATFLVNLIGSLLIGLFVGYQLKYQTNDTLSLLLVTGFCGGFTTFSAFSLESYNLWKAQEWSVLGVYISASLVMGFLLAALGIFLAQRL